MDHAPRLIGLALVLAWWIFRVVRYLQVSRGKPRTDAAAAPTATASPIEPERSGGMGRRGETEDKNPIR